MSQSEIDLYDLSDEDFQKQMEAAQAVNANQNPAADGAEDPEGQQQAQARDEKGRFVSTGNEPEEVDEVVYEREIDLGDGSGVQVFRGATPEELLDKLAEAQVHATRKIRELNTALKSKETAVNPAVADDELWVLSQEMLANPLTAVDKVLAKQLGMTTSQLKERLDRLSVIEQERNTQTVAHQFLEEHPEFHTSKANGDRIERYLKTFQLPETLDNVEQAYRELTESGLLETQPDNSNTSSTTESNSNQSARPRIATTGTKTVVVQRRASSGISPRNQASVTKPEPTVEDLYSMPEEEFFRLGGMSSNGW